MKYFKILCLLYIIQYYTILYFLFIKEVLGGTEGIIENEMHDQRKF